MRPNLTVMLVNFKLGNTLNSQHHKQSGSPALIATPCMLFGCQTHRCHCDSRFWDARSAKITSSVTVQGVKKLLYAVWTPSGHEVLATTSSNLNMIVDVRMDTITDRLPNSIEVRMAPSYCLSAQHQHCIACLCSPTLLPASVNLNVTVRFYKGCTPHGDQNVSPISFVTLILTLHGKPFCLNNSG